MLKKTRIWAGLSTTFASLLCCVAVGSTVADAYSGTINQALNITTSEIVTENPDPNEDTVYYKSSFGDFNEANLKKLQAAAKEQAINEMREGAALLYNPDGALLCFHGIKYAVRSSFCTAQHSHEQKTA